MPETQYITRKEARQDHTEIKALITEGFKGVHKRQDSTNGRLGKLEMWRAGLVGGAVVVVAIAGFAAKPLVKYYVDENTAELNTQIEGLQSSFDAFESDFIIN